MNQHDLYHKTRFLAASGRGMLAIPSGAAARKPLAAVHLHGAYRNRMKMTDYLVQLPELEESIAAVLVGPDALHHLQEQDWKPRAHSVLLGVEISRSECLEAPGKFETWRADGAHFANWTLELPAAVWPDILRNEAETAAYILKACQRAGLVPMVTVDIEGEEKDRILNQFLPHLFKAFSYQGVYLPGMLLRLTSPRLCIGESSDLRRAIPDRLGGIVLDQGFASTKVFREVLRCIGETAPPLPWPVSYSHGEGFVREALAEWQPSADSDETTMEGVAAQLRASLQAYVGVPEKEQLADV